MSSKCPGFQPHIVKPTRCRRCFRDISEHKDSAADSNKTTNNETSDARKRKDSLKSQNTSDGAQKTAGPEGTKAASSATSTVDSSTSQLRRRRERTSNAADEDNKSVADHSSPSTATGSNSLSTAGNNSEEAAGGYNRVRRRQRPLSSAKSEESKDERKLSALDRSDSEKDDYSSDSSDRKSTDSGESRRSRRRLKVLSTEEVDKCTSPQLPSYNSLDYSSANPDVEFILKVKATGQHRECDDESIAATETTETTETTIAFHDSYEDLQDMVDGLKKQLEMAEEKARKFEKEKLDLMQRRTHVSDSDKKSLDKTASDLLKLRSKLNTTEALNEELRDENNCLKLELKEIQQELEKREPSDTLKKEIDTLRNKIQQAENLCEELMEENEEVKKENQDLEQQLEELQDSFREEQQSEFQGLKRELENTSKNCRVLQFKLRKAERRVEQLEMEKGQLDEMVAELQKTTRMEVDKTKMKDLEEELTVAKGLSSKLTAEMEVLKEAKSKLELDNESLRKQVSSGNKSLPQVKESTKTKEAVMGKDYETLCRDLYDSMERETDLREQLRFAEEESKNFRKKMNTLEQENETLVLQLRKMSVSKASREKRESEGSESSDEELSPDEMRLQIDLCEQEMCVLRRRVEELEQQNDNLNSEVKYLQEKLISQPFTKIELPEPPSDGADVDLFHKQKAKLLEYEAKELRQKLIEKERENERLQTEIQVHRRKASKVIVRSRSLDSDLQVDLKRQLQLVEQEAGILRQKTIDLENENEKLQAENKRYHMRLSRKPPPGPQELLQLDNMELKEKLSESERRLNALKEEYEKVAAGAAPSAVILQEYKPRKENVSDTQSELIGSLKKKIRMKEEETSGLQTKILQLEIDNNRLNRDYKKLKDALNYKKRPPRAMRETATRGELRELIRDLEDEISELQVTLRGREVMQEGINEEVDEVRRELETLQTKSKQKEGKLAIELDAVKKHRDELQAELLKEREKSQNVKDQLVSVAKEQNTDVGLIQKASVLQKEKDSLEDKLREADNNLRVEHGKVSELQTRINGMTALNESLSLSSKELERAKKELESELMKQKRALCSAEDQVKALRNKLDNSESLYTAMKKECSQLKNELQEMKMRVSTDVGLKRQPSLENDVTWLKEREELKRTIAELRELNDVMTKQEREKEKQFNEKENRLRSEYERRIERSIQELKESLQAEIKTLHDEHSSVKSKLNEATEQLEKKELELKSVSDKLRHLNNQHRREKDDWTNKMDDLEEKLRTEFRKRERVEREHEMELKSRAEEVLGQQNRMVQLEREHRRMAGRLEEVEMEHENNLKLLEKDLAKERHEYEDLTSKYELLEEEFVNMKSRLTLEKEQVEAALSQLRRDSERSTLELTTLRDSYSVRQEAYMREKLELQNQIRELEAKLTRMKDIESERMRLKSHLNERDVIINEMKKNERLLQEEKDRIRRKNEDLQKKVAELDRAERASRSISSVGKAESQDLKTKLEHSGHVHRAELAATRAEYDARISFLSSEIQNQQAQILSLARERDQCREKLEESAKEIQRLRTDSLRRDRSRSREAAELAQRKAEELKLELDDVKNQLEEALSDNRKVRVQMDADRSSWEIQISSLKSKLNQFEERNLLDASRGSARAYTRTRLELAWEKERSEQQRVLNESQIIVKDLRDRLLKHEEEREKERQELHLQIQLLKKKVDGGAEDLTTDIIELQAELEDAKDNQARMKTQYDRLRREKDRMEREREDMRQRLQALMDIQGKTNDLMEDVRKVMDLVETEGLFAEDQSKAQAMRRPLRMGITPKDDLKNMLEKVAKQTDDLRKAVQPIHEDEKIKRAASFRRAVSATDMATPSRGGGLLPTPTLIRAPPRTRSLNRKSLSLDQSLSQADMKIWASGDSLNITPSGSQTSLRGRSTTGYESDSSIVSEPPRHWSYGRGGFTALRADSDAESSTAGSLENVPAAALKPKKGLKERLKLLKKSKSVDVGPAAVEKAEREEKSQTLRQRISRALKPSSKASSEERLSSDSDRGIHIDRRPIGLERKLEPVPERSVIDSSSVSSKGDRGSKRSLLGRFSGKSSKPPDLPESPLKPAITRGTLTRSGSFTETTV